IARVYGPSRQRNAGQVDRRSIPEPPRHEQRHRGCADPRSQQGSWRRGHSAPQTRVGGAQYQSTHNHEFPQGKPVSYLSVRQSRAKPEYSSTSIGGRERKTRDSGNDKRAGLSGDFGCAPHNQRNSFIGVR
ncbi:unnamed protein product, partial [Ectocarpus sp. 12 AP-2014]